MYKRRLKIRTVGRTDAPLREEQHQRKGLDKPETLIPSLNSEARRDVSRKIVIDVLCIVFGSGLCLFGLSGYLGSHSGLTIAASVIGVLLGISGLIQLVLTPRWAHNRKLRPVLNSPQSCIAEYFGNLQLSQLNSLSYACLDPATQAICESRDEFYSIWQQVICEMKRINREFVMRNWPHKFYEKMNTSLSFQIVTVNQEQDCCEAVITLCLTQFYEYDYVSGYEGTVTEYLEGPVFFDIDVLLSFDGRSWLLGKAIPDVNSIKDSIDAS